MPHWLQPVLAVAAALALAWAALVVALVVQARRAGRRTNWRQLARLVPDVVRLVRRLAADPTLPRPVRWWLWALLAYLVSPIDLVPDVIPVVGYADDAIVVAVALRFVVRHAGRGALERHWPGAPEGLDALLGLVGLGRA